MTVRPKPNRLTSARPQDKVRTYLLDSMKGGVKSGNFPFYFAQVMVATDPENAGRIKVRIPLIDDIYYKGDDGKKSDDSSADRDLPWCIPASNRLFHVPEVNSIVLVGLFNNQKSYNGRVWFSAIEGFSSLDIFSPERLSRENSDWENAEDNIETFYDATPGLRNRAGWTARQSTINYPVGIRGKSKNKLLLDQNKTTLIQNEGENDESKLELAATSLLMAQFIKILSSKSDQKFEPVFARPLFDHLVKIQNLLTTLLTTLSVSPGMITSALVAATLVPIPPLPPSIIPILPNPAIASLLSTMTTLQTDLANLMLPGEGSSKFIKIN